MSAPQLSYRIFPVVDNEPTFTWAAYRVLHAGDRLNELEALHEQTAQEWQSRLTVSVNPSDPAAGVELDFAGVQDDFETFGHSLAAHASEVIHHLRSALDFLAYNAAWRDSGEQNKDALFPLDLKSGEWNRREKRHTRGISTEHREWIREVQPFTGVLWSRQLKLLSNSDKHFQRVRVVPALETIASANVLTGPHPNRAGFFLLEVQSESIHLLIADPLREEGGDDEYVDASHFLWNLIDNVRKLVNRFLVDEGHEPVQLVSMPRATP
ncbi:hypothetical protein ACLD0U_05045 [Microbacterium sp. 2216-1]|uniref:hypothetical protein n=1 Tax=Microbacterium sp. 2216-1 TaxID=3390053 RepID=UPI0039765CC3